MLCTHTRTLNYSALCQQPGSISSNGESRSYIHTPKHKHTSFIARGGLFSSTLLLRPNTNVHTRGIFLSTWLQLGAEQDKELHRTSLNTDRWETSYTSRRPPSSLTHTNKHGRISDTRTTSTGESALTSRIFGEARVLVQECRNLCDKQETTVIHRQATLDIEWI